MNEIKTYVLFSVKFKMPDLLHCTFNDKYNFPTELIIMHVNMETLGVSYITIYIIF